jgi:hypothetical protein
MDTKELVGLFVIGTLKSGVQFLGVVERTDDQYLYLDYKNSKKFVLISEIAEMKSEPYKDEVYHD